MIVDPAPAPAADATTPPAPVAETAATARARAVACGRAIEAALAEHNCAVVIRPQVVPVGEDGTVQVRPSWFVVPNA